MDSACLGPRPRMTVPSSSMARRISAYASRTYDETRRCKGCAHRFLRIRGWRGAPLWYLRTLAAAKKVHSFDNSCQRPKNLHPGIKFLFVQEKILTLHNPQGQIRYILNKIAFIAVGSVHAVYLYPILRSGPITHRFCLQVAGVKPTPSHLHIKKQSIFGHFCNFGVRFEIVIQRKL